MFLRRTRTLLAVFTVALLGGLIGAGVAQAGYYFANTSGAFGTVSNGAYTNAGPNGSWALGVLDNENTGAPKFHFRIKYNAGCSGGFSAPQWYSGNYGNPKNWTIPYSSGGCGYSYGQNVSGGNARLSAGQF